MLVGTGLVSCMRELVLVGYNSINFSYFIVSVHVNQYQMVKQKIDKPGKYLSKILLMISTERYTIRHILTKWVNKFMEFNW